MVPIFRKKETQQKQYSPVRKDVFIDFSALFFIFLLGSAAFIILMGRIIIDNTGKELIKVVELEQIKLEASLNSEIAIGLKMADSPLIKRYFSNPTDLELENMAFQEFAAYRKAFSANSVFWINDIDKLFYIDEHKPYRIDTDNSDNYWYPMTLYDTEVYNFNINFNPDLNVTNLWINAPVFNDEEKAIGIVGTGINLSDFINAIYYKYSGNASIYFFNNAGEITGAKDISLIERKVKIEDELYQIKADIISGINEYKSESIKYIETKVVKGVVVIARIPALDWYVIAVQRLTIFDSLKTGMTALFIVLMLVIFLIFMIHESKLDKARVEAVRDAVISSIEYAGKIQKNMLPDKNLFNEAFSDYSIIWKPRDIVGGDIYWIKNFDDGTVLCVCDCTGHGTPGALLTMLVVSTFEAMVTDNNYKDTAQIIWELEKRLVNTLNAKNFNEESKSLNIKDGCDLAVLFIAKDGSVTSSSSHIHIFVCDGKKVTQIKGQRIYVGEGKLKHKDDIKTVHTPAESGNKFYIASDGLFDQPGGEKTVPFGYKAFVKIILENHNENQSAISDIIWTAFEKYRNDRSRVDDFELISFKPRAVN